MTNSILWDTILFEYGTSQKSGVLGHTPTFPRIIEMILNMIEILQTDFYKQWFASLKDRNAKARIDIRIRRISLGNLGDVKPVGEGVSEIRIDYGPG